MKSIILTKEHKTKLLEMCKELFPKYNRFIGFYKTEDETFYKEKIYKFNLLHLIGDKDIQIIHWFEFCMTHLAEKIIAVYITNKDGDKIYKRTLNDDLSKFYLESLNFSRGYNKQHPVDYLYSEFKKLKL